MMYEDVVLVYSSECILSLQISASTTDTGTQRKRGSEQVGKTGTHIFLTLKLRFIFRILYVSFYLGHFGWEIPPFAAPVLLVKDSVTE